MDPSFWDLRRPSLHRYPYHRRWARHPIFAAYNIDRHLYQPNRPRQQILPSFSQPSPLHLLPRPPHQTLAAYNVDSSHLSDQTTVTEYIYCIKLPHFECKPQSTSTHSSQAVRQARRYAPYPLNFMGNAALTQLAKLLQPQQTLYEVVKIGKTKDPAERFHDILGPFQNLPEVQVPLLQEISSTDDPQTVLRKVKLCDPVIFLIKVRNIGTAEKDIRKAFGIPLGQGFIEQFLESISKEEQKKRFKKDSGMTEWVVMDAKLAVHLQTTFRTHLRPFVKFNILCPYHTPSGDEIYRQLFAEGSRYYSQRIRIRSTSLPPGFHISFPPTNFSYTLQIPTENSRSVHMTV